MSNALPLTSRTLRASGLIILIHLILITVLVLIIIIVILLITVLILIIILITLQGTPNNSMRGGKSSALYDNILHYTYNTLYHIMIYNIILYLYHTIL